MKKNYFVKMILVLALVVSSFAGCSFGAQDKASGKNGKINLESLVAGNWHWQEIEGPDGFIASDEEIHDLPLVVGDCLDKFDFRHNDEKRICVRNYKLGVDYEVIKVASDYVP